MAGGSSYAARMLGKRWWHLRMAHVGYFNRRTFEQATAAAGLQVVDRTYAKWYFSVRYVAERLNQYVPIGPLMRRGNRDGFWGRRFDRIIAINPFDSYLFILKHR